MLKLWYCIVITETWLKSYVSDAQLQIPGYNITRCDRESRVGGGVLLYSHESMPQTSHDIFDDGICQGLFAVFEASKACKYLYHPYG